MSSISALLDKFSQQLKSGSEYYLVIASIILILLVIYLFYRYFGKHKLRIRMRRLVRRLSSDYIEDIYLKDPLGEEKFYDYLLLTPQGVVVLDVKDYEGYLFGAEHIDQWTQMIGRKSYKFPNPLYQNAERVMAIRDRFPDLQVRGCVLFTQSGRFPKGIPDGVCTMHTIYDELKQVKKEKVSAALGENWALLKNTVESQRALAVSGNRL